MKRELMELGRWDLQNAKWNLNESDDIAPRFAAYHIQQAVEKVVKCVLKELGVSYTKTHRINDLLARLPDGQDILSEEWIDWLEENAATLYEWESNARYTEGYTVSRRYAVRVFEKVSALHKEVLQVLSQRDSLAETADAAQQQTNSATVKPSRKLNLGGSQDRRE